MRLTRLRSPCSRGCKRSRSATTSSVNRRVRPAVNTRARADLAVAPGSMRASPPAHFSTSTGARLLPSHRPAAAVLTRALVLLSTAGVWRRACIEKAGGWNARTTVEDMDLSLRAYLQGWRFVFLHDVTVRAQRHCALTTRTSVDPSLASPPVPQRAAQQLRRVPQAAAPLVLRAYAAVAQGDLSGVGLQHLVGAEAVPKLVRAGGAVCTRHARRLRGAIPLAVSFSARASLPLTSSPSSSTARWCPWLVRTITYAGALAHAT